MAIVNQINQGSFKAVIINKNYGDTHELVTLHRQVSNTHHHNKLLAEYYVKTDSYGAGQNTNCAGTYFVVTEKFYLTSA
jgi:hypothetical protein